MIVNIIGSRTLHTRKYCVLLELLVGSRVMIIRICTVVVFSDMIHVRSPSLAKVHHGVPLHAILTETSVGHLHLIYLRHVTSVVIVTIRLESVHVVVVSVISVAST